MDHATAGWTKWVRDVFVVAAAAAVVASGAGCGGGRGNVHVTVTSGGLVRAVASLHVTVTLGGATAAPLDVPIPGGAHDLPPAVDFALLFDGDRHGDLALVVEARDAAAKPLATATTTAVVEAGKTSEAVLLLPGGPPPAPDAGSFPDAGAPDGAPADGANADGSIGDLAKPLVFTRQAVAADFLGLVAGSGPKDVYVGGSSVVLRSTDGTTWSDVSPKQSGSITSLWVTPGGIVYATSGDLLGTWNHGVSWSSLHVPSAASVCAFGDSELFVTNGDNDKNGQVAHSSDGGASWTYEATGDSNLGAITCCGVGDVFAQGAGGVVHRTNGTWSTEAGPEGGATRLWCPSAAETYSVMPNNVSLRQGGAWTKRLEPPPGVLFRGIGGSGPSDVYVVGGKTLFRTGDSGLHWTQVTLPQADELNGVWAAGPHDVYVVGNGGGIFHGM